jgi:uncharacterized protein (TIGR02145 family)
MLNSIKINKFKKKDMIKLSLKLLFLLLLVTQIVFSQVRLKVGTDPTNMTSSSAVLELESTSKGLLLPRLARTSVSNSGTTIPSGLLIYDTAAGCTRVYQNGVWSTCLNASSYNYNQTSNGSAVVSSYACSALSGNLIKGVASTVTLTITATVSTAGTYAIQATANGVTFSGSGTFLITGSNSITLTAIGTPLAASTTTFALNTSPSCSTIVSVITSSAICDGTSPTAVVEIVSSTGRTWMDRNLGASRAATSVTDFYAYGCLYQWGRGNDGHASINWVSATSGTPTSNITTTTRSTIDSPGNATFINTTAIPYDWISPSSTTLWQTTGNTNNNPCPTDFHIPTYAELSSEFTYYGMTNSALAYSNGPLGGFKFLAVGNRTFNGGVLQNTNTAGGYWSSTISTSASAQTVNFTSSNNSTVLTIQPKSYGLSVRCIKN